MAPRRPEVNYRAVGPLGSSAPAPGDFNGDNALDLAVIGEGNTVSVYLNTPVVALFPNSLTFDNQDVGTTSGPQTVTLYNPSVVPLSISGMAATGDFAQTNTCPVSVTFTPAAPFTRTGALTISDNGIADPQSIALTGTGVGPLVSLSPTDLDFGKQTVGTTSPPQTVTLTNTGNATLTISSIAGSGDFAQTNDCGPSMAQGDSCTITVTFTPTVPGPRTGAITITDNAPDSPQMVNLMGTGI